MINDQVRTLFEAKNPKAMALLSLVDASGWTRCKTEKGEDILYCGSSSDKIFLHDPKGAKKEADLFAKTLPLDTADILILFGVGFGYYYEALSDWLKNHPEKKVIFLEDDLALLSHFLESERALQLLQDPQVLLYYLEESQEGVELLRALSWLSFKKVYHFQATPLYAVKRKKHTEAILERLLYEASDIHAVLDEYTEHGIAYFRNFWRNLRFFSESFIANRLFSTCKNIPAIVCAAGPSLEKAMPELEQLQNKALIFAGGSSVNALCAHGITPHFGAGIDPNPLQYMRLREGLAFEVPFFYRHRFLHEALQSVTGEKLYLCGGDGYNISEYFEKKAKLPKKVLGGGHSVSNFIIEIAHALGCSPIILVGYDLAYGKEKKRYAKGVEESHPAHVARGTEETPIEAINGKNEPIETHWKWLLERDWIEDFTKKKGKKRFITTSQEGLVFDGLSCMTLEDVKKEFLQTSYDLRGLVHTAIYSAKEVNFGDKKLTKEMGNMFDSLTASFNTLEELKRLDQESVSAGFYQQELESEISYQFILEVFDRMQTKMDHYRFDLLLHPLVDDQEVKRDARQSRLAYLQEVCVVNQLLIKKVIDEMQVCGTDVSGFCPKREGIVHEKAF